MELLNHRVSAGYESFSFSVLSLAVDMFFVFNLDIQVCVYFVKCLLKTFAHFFLLSCMSFFLLHMGVLFIFWILILSQILVLWVSFPNLRVTFSLLKCLLRTRSYLIYQLFLYSQNILGTIKKYLCLRQYHKDDVLCFFYEYFVLPFISQYAPPSRIDSCRIWGGGG